jgi:hypothetical protein
VNFMSVNQSCRSPPNLSPVLSTIEKIDISNDNHLQLFDDEISLVL